MPPFGASNFKHFKAHRRVGKCVDRVLLATGTMPLRSVHRRAHLMLDI
jgi:hypothetical protein